MIVKLADPVIEFRDVEKSIRCSDIVKFIIKSI